MLTRTSRPSALLLAVLPLSLAASAAPVVVSLSNASPSFTTGQMFAVGLLADIPAPVLGFGVDVNFDASKLSLNSFTVGPSWFAATGTEPNDFIGLAFPTPVVGAGTLLGTFSFTALTTGSTTIKLAFNSQNLAEGFPLLAGGFADTNLPDESQVTGAVPEPAPTGTVGVPLLAAAVAVYIRRRAQTRV